MRLHKILSFVKKACILFIQAFLIYLNIKTITDENEIVSI